MTCRTRKAALGIKSGGAFLSLRGLTKRYDDFLAVDDIDLDVPKGELVALLGPSGCGKTTSLRMIAGLTPQSAGQIVVGGKDLTGVPPYRRDMGLVFQSYALFPHMTRREERRVRSRDARRVARGRDREARARGARARAPAGHGRRDGRRALSGGQQQRVALARALVIRPSILLLDEPLSNLDAKLRDEMRNEIRDIQQRLGITAIFVTHDQAEALTHVRQGRGDESRQARADRNADRALRAAAHRIRRDFVGRTNRIGAQARNGSAEFAGQQFAVPAGS